MKHFRAVILAMPLLIILATTCPAQVLNLLEFSGQMYEEVNVPGSPGFPPSDQGDVLAAVGFAQEIDPALPWDLELAEFTLVLSGLVSQGQNEIIPGVFGIDYDFGTLKIVADDYAGGGFTAADYGVDPPNATSPATFEDGDTYLVGEFVSFEMHYVEATNTGDFEGLLFWTGGSELDSDFINVAEGYALSGTAQVVASPDGYDLQMVGHISFDPAISAEENTWSGVKNLFRR